MLILRLFLAFFLIGLFSIGGGYAIIPLIQEQVVDKYGWLAQSTFSDIITISQMTPGPIAVNTATFVGIQISGILGAVVATIGCIIGGVFVSNNLYRFFKKHRDSKIVFEVLNGLKASSLGLIMSAAAAMLLLAFTGSNSLGGSMDFNWIAGLIFCGAFIVLRKWKINPLIVIAASGLIGAFVY